MKKDTFNSEIERLAYDIVRLVVLKQRDYGKNNILHCPVGAKVGVLVRLNDKLNRLGNLLTKNKDPKHETIRDTWEDIVGYGLIGLMLEDKTFQLPLDETEVD